MTLPGDPRSVLRNALARRPRLRQRLRNSWRALTRVVEGPERTEVQRWLDETLPRLTPTEWSMLTERADGTVALPDDADRRLALDHPRLRALRAAYQDSNLPVTAASVWNERLVERELDLRRFRGESPFVWNYREWPRAMELKYFLFAEYVRSRDSRGLLERLGEDGAFGCWTFQYPGYPPVSRDLLDSVNEMLFLDRTIGLLDWPQVRVLDIGAGYGRTAYRMTQCADVGDYCCVDAVPESTFVSEYYLQFRGCVPPARVVPLHELDDAIAPGAFDLAVNIHSFSECTYAAVSWWIDWIEHLQIPNLLVVPNDRDQLLAFEPDGTRRDFRPLVESAGYTLSASEPVFVDPAVRELLRVPDHFLLFRRAT